MLALLGKLIYWYPLRAIVQLMPPSEIYSLADILGIIWYYSSPALRKKIAIGLSSLFSDAELEKTYLYTLAKETLVNYVKNALETFIYPRLNSELADRLFTYQGLEYIDNALARGKGVILLHGHFGNEELLWPALGFKGYKIYQLASRWMPIQNFFLSTIIAKQIYKLRISYREKLPVKFIYIDRGIFNLFKVLEENNCVLIAGDGREGKKWVEVKFLGRIAYFSPNPYAIALKTSASVLPIFLVRLKNNQHKLIVEPPLLIEKDLSISAQRFASLLEQYVKKYPSHYAKVFWLAPQMFKNSFSCSSSV